MQKLTFPHVILPAEFISILKTNQSASGSVTTFIDVLKSHPALYFSMQVAFKEFDDGRGLEKTILALGWTHFRERLSSMYVYKAIHGVFPNKTDLELVDGIRRLEARFIHHTIQGISRVYLLGFYLSLANIQTQKRQSNKFLELRVPDEINTILKLSQGRSEKIDLLIITLIHLTNALGENLVLHAISSGKKFEDLYDLMSSDARKNMNDNLLAYAASILEPDIFLYEKV